MGQVLMDFAPPKFIARLGYTGDDAQALLQEVFKGWEWVAFDRGDITGEDVAASACSRLPERLHDGARELVFHWWERMIPMPGAKDLVTELYGKGYDMYVLSNASQDFHRYFDRIPGSEYLPRARRFVSSDYGLLKPQDPRQRVSAPGAAVRVLGLWAFEAPARDLRAVPGEVRPGGRRLRLHRRQPAQRGGGPPPGLPGPGPPGRPGTASAGAEGAGCGRGSLIYATFSFQVKRKSRPKRKAHMQREVMAKTMISFYVPCPSKYATTPRAMASASVR